MKDADFSKLVAKADADTKALRKLARRGNAEAMYRLACRASIDSLGLGGYLRNLRWAIYWAEKADRAGYKLAPLFLGHKYVDSRNPRFDPEKALIYYRRAAATGDEYAKECVADTLKMLKKREPKKKSAGQK